MPRDGRVNSWAKKFVNNWLSELPMSQLKLFRIIQLSLFGVRIRSRLSVFNLRGIFVPCTHNVSTHHYCYISTQMITQTGSLRCTSFQLLTECKLRFCCTQWEKNYYQMISCKQNVPWRCYSKRLILPDNSYVCYRNYNQLRISAFSLRWQSRVFPKWSNNHGF